MPKKLPSIEYLRIESATIGTASMPTRGHSHEAGSSMAASTGYRAKWRMLRGLWHEAFGPARRA